MENWQEAGDPRGFPVLVHHGTPGPREFDPAAHRCAAGLGLRLIMTDRPGYGTAPAQPDRRAADTAAEVDAARRRFGFDRLACVGYSGGGVSALAAAALRPESVVRAAVLAGMAPYPAVGWDWFEGLDPGGAAELTDALHNPDALAERVRGSRAWMRSVSPKDFLAALSPILAPADREALEGEFGAFLFPAMARAAEAAEPGWFADNRASMAPWGFEPSSIDRPVLVVHGEGDRIIPPGHGRFLARTIPVADFRLLSGAGHFAVWTLGLPQALGWIAAGL